MSDDQPTIEELHKAWTNAIYAEGVGGWCSEARGELVQLRAAKHTWVGKEENDLRFALDSYLRGDK